MKKYYRSTLIILLCLVLPGTGLEISAQGLFEKPMHLPTKYLNPTIHTQNNTGIDSEFSPQWWYVWADRDGVQTSSGKTANFMEEFFVVEEKEDRVHIVKDNGSFDRLAGEFQQVKQPIDYGWVMKNNLILWNTALYNDKTRFREKVLTITDIASMGEREEQIKRGEKIMEYYNSPTASITNSIETKLFEVFYIYKKVGSRSLLGIKESLKKNSQHTILGWADNEIIQTWGDRQTLEPNSKSEAAQERKRSGVRSSVFTDTESANTYKTDPGKALNAFWNDDHYEQGYGTYWKRFPILSSENGIIETAVISDLIAVSNEGGEVKIDTIDAAEYEQITEMFNEQTERTRKINIVFVIDGTRSMEAPIASVKTAVIKTARGLDQSINKFQFGAVIYRDYIDKNDESCFEQQRLGDYSSFYSFMNRIKTDDPACFNNTVSEGLYKGLLKGCKLFRGRERETNVIVLVGDAGDREASWRVDEEEVLKQMVRSGASLITIQAHNFEDKAYNDFIFQAKDLSLKTAEELTDIQIKKYGQRNMTGRSSRPQYKSSTIGNRTMFNLEYSPVDGGLQYAKKKEEIPASVIESEVIRIINEIDSSNTELLNSLSMMISSYGETGFTREAIQMLINANFSNEFIEILSKKRYQFLIKGFTAYDLATLDKSVYDFILFVDGDELNDLIITLSSLTNPNSTASDRREALYNAFMQILVVNYGVKVSDIKGRNIAEIMKLITGLESTSELLKKYTLDDIMDPITMNDQDLDELIQYIKIKRDVLSRIVNDKDYYFLSNLRPYYWLSQEILP